MYKYGQYCPIAKAVEIVGDRWTLLIVRDLLTGTRHFNDLERGLPGISRGPCSMPRSEKNSILAPSGDSAGKRSWARWLERFRCLVPSAAMR